jgi:hypothetical protein
VFNRSTQAVDELVKEQAIGAASLADIVKKFDRPRAIGMKSAASHWLQTESVMRGQHIPIISHARRRLHVWQAMVSLQSELFTRGERSISESENPRTLAGTTPDGHRSDKRARSGR